MGDFIKCPKGHIYDKELGECPYCSGKKIEDDLEDLPWQQIDPPESAMCYDIGPRTFSDPKDNW